MGTSGRHATDADELLKRVATAELLALPCELAFEGVVSRQNPNCTPSSGPADGTNPWLKAMFARRPPMPAMPGVNA